MLRASIDHAGADYDLDGVIGDGDGNIPDGAVLIEFAEAAIGADQDRLSRARAAVLQALGPESLVDAAGVVATFNAIDRVADSTGTPVEDDRLAQTEDIREHLGINQFPSVAPA